jgi:hypothetical protein
MVTRLLWTKRIVRLLKLLVHVVGQVALNLVRRKHFDFLAKVPQVPGKFLHRV